MNALGRHILVEYFDCDKSLLDRVPFIETQMVESARLANATVINSTFHHFSPFGVSGVVVIQESHLAIHTWPEFGYAAVDIFTCGDTVDPWVAYQELKKRLGAGSGSSIEMLRGQPGLIPNLNHQADTESIKGDRKTHNPSIQPKYTRNVWFTERNDNVAFSLRHKGTQLFREQSPWQLVEIFDTLAFGRMLTLDKMVMTSQKDEFVYHEMIVHPALFSKPGIKKVLIIGGGDGGAARELLRHPGIESITLVEIDEAVVRASREYLPELACSFDDPKLKLIIGDGIEFVAGADSAAFDLVLVDSTDPVGPGQGLFTAEFYKNVYRILSPRGLMVTQSESPQHSPDLYREIYACYSDIFGSEQVHSYLAWIPTYPSGMWSFSWCSKNPGSPVNHIDAQLIDEFAERHQLRYYHSALHRAAFVLPLFVKKLLKQACQKQTEIKS